METLLRDPRKLLDGIVQAEADATPAEREALVGYILDQSDQREWLESLVGHSSRRAQEAGVRNDLQQLRTLNELPSSKSSFQHLLCMGPLTS